jgi:hypothetical protein
MRNWMVPGFHQCNRMRGLPARYRRRHDWISFMQRLHVRYIQPRIRFVCLLELQSWSFHRSLQVYGVLALSRWRLRSGFWLAFLPSMSCWPLFECFLIRRFGSVPHRQLGYAIPRGRHAAFRGAARTTHATSQRRAGKVARSRSLADRKCKIAAGINRTQIRIASQGSEQPILRDRASHSVAAFGS